MNEDLEYLGECSVTTGYIFKFYCDGDGVLVDIKRWKEERQSDNMLTADNLIWAAKIAGVYDERVRSRK